MSRTYRRDFISLDINDKPRNDKYFEDGREYWEQGHCDYYSKRNHKRDRKSFIYLSEKTPILVVGDESDLFERSENIK